MGAISLPDRLTKLQDFPSSYTGQALKVPRVNSGETGIEFYTPMDIPFVMQDDWVSPSNLSGSRATTTLAAQMLSGTYDALLTDASSFSVGQGISIVGAGSAGPNNNELITTISAINGNTVTVSNVSTATAAAGNTAYHDDTSAIRTAVQSGGRIYLPAPSAGYNVTSRIDFVLDDTTLIGSDIFSVAPDGSYGGYGFGNTTPKGIYSRIKNDYLFKVAAGVDHTSMAGFVIRQDSGVTPTSGGGILVGEISDTATHPQPTSIKNVGVYGTYNGVQCARQFQTFIDWLTVRQCANAGLYVGGTNTVQGGSFYSNILAEENGFAGIYITQADHDHYQNIRTWTSGNSSGAALYINSLNPVYNLVIYGVTLDNLPTGTTGIKTRKGAGAFYNISISQAIIHKYSGSSCVDIGQDTYASLDDIYAYGSFSGITAFTLSGTAKLKGCRAHGDNSGTGFNIASTAQNVTMTGCSVDGVSIGLTLTAGATNSNIQNNDFSNASTPIVYGSGTRNAKICGNTGSDDWITSIASAPNFVGQMALVSNQWYKAKGTASTADWVLLG